jgi:hypothetical protein
MHARAGYLLVVLSVILMTGVFYSCGGGNDSGNEQQTIELTVAQKVCTNNPEKDSTVNDGITETITSWDKGISSYGVITTRHTQTGSLVSVDYMVHEPPNGLNPKALVILFSGGGGGAGISGTGALVESSGPNFLVRSAHLLAEEGFVVVTIDRADDWPFNWIEIINDPYNPKPPDYDHFRASMSHAVDISRVINDVNKDYNLPVFLVGTSRGSLSPVSNHLFSSGISISSPLTDLTLGMGLPLNEQGSPESLQADSVTVPTQIVWHKKDGCEVTTPDKAFLLASAFFDNNLDVSVTEVSGGFDNSSTNTSIFPACMENTYHGFLGIESCAILETSGWISGIADAIDKANSNPTALSQTISDAVKPNSAISISLAPVATDSDGDPLAYTLPYSESSLSGSINVTGEGSIIYSAPASIAVTTTDTFVYVVDDNKGGIAHNVIYVNLVPYWPELVLYDDFNMPEIDTAKWTETGIGGVNSAMINKGKLNLSATSADATNFINIGFTNPGLINTIAADVKVTEFVDNGGYSRARLGGRFYNADAGSSTLIGDVWAEIGMTDTDIYYTVIKYLDNTGTSWENISGISGDGRIKIGETSLNEVKTLYLKWDGSKFMFQINDEDPHYFDPVSAGASIENASPNIPYKAIGTRSTLASGESNKITADFDNIRINEVP